MSAVSILFAWEALVTMYSCKDEVRCWKCTDVSVLPFLTLQKLPAWESLMGLFNLSIMLSRVVGVTCYRCKYVCADPLQKSSFFEGPFGREAWFPELLCTTCVKSIPAQVILCNGVLSSDKSMLGRKATSEHHVQAANV